MNRMNFPVGTEPGLLGSRKAGSVQNLSVRFIAAFANLATAFACASVRPHTPSTPLLLRPTYNYSTTCHESDATADATSDSPTAWKAVASDDTRKDGKRTTRQAAAPTISIEPAGSARR